jgi:hypothetical protein
VAPFYALLAGLPLFDIKNIKYIKDISTIDDAKILTHKKCT